MEISVLKSVLKEYVTKKDFDGFREEIRQNFRNQGALFEELREQMKAISEVVLSIHEKLDSNLIRLDTMLEKHDQRIIYLELKTIDFK